MDPALSTPTKALSHIQSLEKRSQILRRKLLKHKAAKRFYHRSQLLAYELRQKSQHLLTGAGLVSTLLFSTPVAVPTIPASSSLTQLNQEDVSARLIGKLTSIVPHRPAALNP